MKKQDRNSGYFDNLDNLDKLESLKQEYNEIPVLSRDQRREA